MSRAKKPEASVVEKDGAWWIMSPTARPFATNGEAWRHIDRNRTPRTIDRAEELQRAVRMLNDALDELGYALRNPGEFPITRETVEWLEENATRVVRLLTKVEMMAA